MEEEKDVVREVNWGAFGLLAALIGLAWLGTWAFLEKPAKQTAPDPIVQTTAPVVDPAPSQAAPVKASPAPRGCYIGPKPNMFHKTSETRKEYASDRDVEIQKIVGTNLITVVAAGEDSEILLFTSPPESVNYLNQMIAMIRPNPSARDRICEEGFAEVQFIVRDEEMHQTLLAKWDTSLVELFRHADQQYGATPMK